MKIFFEEEYLWECRVKCGKINLKFEDLVFEDFIKLNIDKILVRILKIFKKMVIYLSC